MACIDASEPAQTLGAVVVLAHEATIIAVRRSITLRTVQLSHSRLMSATGRFLPRQLWVECGREPSYSAIMNTDTEQWLELGRRLGIEVAAPVEIELAGAKAQFTALLPQFGAPLGMIVDADWDAIEPHKSALLAAGYGFSCVDGGDPADFDDPEILSVRRDMLADWGWSSASPKRDWLQG
jgi:hypothetical protein